MLLKIAWRNIWRNPLRSGVIIISLMVGLWAGVFIIAFFGGMINEQISTAVSRQFSHLQIHSPAYKQEEKLSLFLPQTREVQQFASSQQGVVAVTSRMLVTAMAATAHGSAGVTIYGVNPAKENAVTGIENYIVEGSWLDEKKLSGAVIGKKLKDKLGLSIGQKIILTFQNNTDEISAAAFRVAGIYKSNNSSSEETILYVNTEELAPLTGLQINDAHEVAILLQDNGILESKAAMLRSQFPTLKVETWKQLSPELRLMIDSFRQYMYIIIGIILLALVFGIVNTMLMAVLERQHELGVLMAVGMNQAKVFSMILFETVFMTIAGLAFGLPLAWLSVWWFGKQGIDLSNWSEGLAMYGYGTMVYPSLELSYYLEIALMAVAASLLAAIYPARRSLKLKPSEAIRKI